MVIGHVDREGSGYADGLWDGCQRPDPNIWITEEPFIRGARRVCCIVELVSDVLLQFRLLSKPCSVIRDVTLGAVDMLDAANVKPSKNTRVVLSKSSI